MGIGTMTRKEKAVIYVKSQYLTQSPLLPGNEDYEEVHFEVELVHLIQVRDALCTKNRSFMFVHYNPISMSVINYIT